VFRTVTLHDGRTLEYADLGDPAGTPVLLFHGTPSTAGQAAVVADGAGAHGIRLVAASRPGYGASTNTPPGLTPAAADAVELVDRLGVDRVVVMGVSGGGPYALALAALAPERISDVLVLAGPGNHSEVTPEMLDDDDRAAVALMAEGDTEAAVALMTTSAKGFLGGLQGMSPAEFHAALASFSPPGETWLDEHPRLRSLFEADFQRAITPLDGFVRDNLSWLGPWDFELAAVTIPVTLVHGEQDAMVPRAHGDWLHARLPESRQRVIPGGHGHVSFGAAIDTFAAIGSS
jgi:pimeloyl-ACP methyl ester carboxylesterase